jgi:hypothetical protein
MALFCEAGNILERRQMRVAAAGEHKMFTHAEITPFSFTPLRKKSIQRVQKGQ